MSAAKPVELNIAHIIEVLNRHEVEYVVIGGAAAEVWAASVGISVRPTLDIDFTPNNSRENLDRLSSALEELGANIRTSDAPTGLAFSHDGESLGRSLVWNLICSAGPFDLSFIPSGTEGYSDLARRARLVLVQGLETPLTALEDIVRSKRAANRPKDIEMLPFLEEALRRMQRSQ
jgi:hypothetical protein